MGIIIGAHAASGVEQGDAAEARAIATVFAKSTNSQPAVSSTKGATGHLLGAAGWLICPQTLKTLQEYLAQSASLISVSVAIQLLSCSWLNIAQ